MKHYDAPWSPSLKVISLLSSVLCLSLAVTFFLLGDSVPRGVAVVPLGLLFVTVPFTIRGYVVTPKSIEVRRLFWRTRLPIEGLTSVEFNSEAMSSSIRIGGNGGMFSFSGYFLNRTLGTYRVLVTDLKRSVVLKYGTRTFVVSPSDPEDFVREVTERMTVYGSGK